MKVLLKHVTIADQSSPYNGQKKDILIENGIIRLIQNQITEAVDTVVETADLIVSPGWVDVFCNFCDPGAEYKETIETGAMAAAAGGYVHAFAIPNTTPAVFAKTQVEYIIQRSNTVAVNIYPIGAVTKNIEGKELAEMYDMRNSGAIAFSDGLKPVQTPGLLLKALQYVNAFEGTIIQLPVDASIGSHGLMNEGITSTRLGLQGIPQISEELLVARDIELAKYTGSKLHITGITTAKSVALIQQAKADGVQVTCSVTPYHLFYNDEDLFDYNTNLKVNPPLRNRYDAEALKEAVLSGAIDCISSHHQPQDWDNKTCEFEYAKPGMIGLQTTYNVINTLFPGMELEKLIALLTTNARNIFKLSAGTVEEDAVADITLFKRNGSFTLTKENIKSKSHNSAFLNTELKGRVIGIINQEKVYLNQ